MEDTSHRIASLEEHVPREEVCRELKDEAGLSNFATLLVWAPEERVFVAGVKGKHVLMARWQKGRVISSRDEDLPAPTATELVKLIRAMEPEIDLPHDPDGLAAIYLALKAEVDANGFLSHKQDED